MKTSIAALLIAALTLTAGCAGRGAGTGSGGGADGIHDPFEASNRRVHAFNKRLDSGSGSGGGLYARALPEDVRGAVSRISENLTEPGSLVNHLFQGDLPGVARNVGRFAVNSTFGFAGLFDVAAEAGIAKDDSDFGETLYVWGAPEGAYLELPVLGPSTQRDAAGRVVDLFTNPLSNAMTPRQRAGAFALRVGKKLDDRARLGNTIDAVLYDSADSYAQARLIYLQNRRFELGDSTTGAAEADPMALDTEGF